MGPLVEVKRMIWDKAGKLRAQRHPMNGYRLYPRGVVLDLIRRIRSQPALATR